MTTMNALAIVKSIMDKRSMRQTGGRMQTRVLNACNDAVVHLSADFPEAFVTRTAEVPVKGVVDGSELGVRLAVDEADPMILRFTDTGGSDITTGAAWLPAVDKTWDGIYTLMVKQGEVWTTRWCRTFFARLYTPPVGAAYFRYCVALDSRWRTTTDTLLEFKLVQTQFALPAGMSDPQDPILFQPTSGGTYQMEREGRMSFRARRKPPDSDIVGGYPGRYSLGDTRMLPPPSAAPVLTALGAPAWAGVIPQGRFYFCYTYGLGSQGADRRTPSGLFELTWESAPSPVAIFDHSTSAGVRIQMKGQNIEPELGFYDNAGTAPRHSRSGLIIRWYVARANDTGTPATASPAQKDLTFYALSDTKFLTTDACTYVWDGSTFPEMRIELRPTYAYRLYDVSHPFAVEGTLHVQAMSAPLPLKHPADILEINEKAMPAFMQLALYYTCLADGVDQADAQTHLSNYESLKGQVSRNVNSPADSYPMAQVGSRGGRGSRLDRWRQLHDDDDFTIEV